MNKAKRMNMYTQIFCINVNSSISNSKISRFINLLFLMLFMISEKQIENIRQELKESENPLFFFDDDPDGLCSYLLLRKYIEKGKGVVVKGSATLDVKYIKKVEEN